MVRLHAAAQVSALWMVGVVACVWGQPVHAGPDQGTRVYTRAVVRSLPSSAEPDTVRLKILPRGKVPFTTMVFRVDQPGLLGGIQVGDEVGFLAERRAAGNTLTQIRKVAPCVRFQPCPPITAD